MRRVALVSEHASPLGALGGVDGGGQNVYVAQLACHLAARGWRVDVLTRADDPGLPAVLDWRPGVRVVHVAAGPAEALPKEALLEHMPSFAVVARAHCAAEGYDLLHANFWMSGLVCAEVKRATGIPFVVTFHALGRVRRQHQGAADGFPDARFAIEERVAREADLVIAECPQDRDDLIALYGADPARIRLAACGVDPEEFRPVDRRAARAVLGLPQDVFILLQLGRMVPRKGVDTVIEGFAAFRAATGAKARLLVVGGQDAMPDPATDPELARLTRLAAHRGAADAVTFTGRRDRDVLRYHYAAADAFATLPWYEPFGITPLEAMASGVPVIGARVGGIKHSVVDGETGLLVPPRDPAAFAQALARLHAEPELRARLGRAGRARVLDRFTWERVARDVETIYVEALGAVPARAPRPSGARAGRAFDDLREVLARARDALAPDVPRFAAEIGAAFAAGGKLLVAGNGGSAAEAQHMAAELVGRFEIDGRPGLPAIALCADSAFVTAWSNDFGYADVFARQVEAFGRPGDVFVAFSTSGASANLVRALKTARAGGLRTLALLGRDGGAMRALSDLSLVVPSDSTPRIQEVHQLLLHQICALVEEAAMAGRSVPARVRRGVVPIALVASGGDGMAVLRGANGRVPRDGAAPGPAS